MAQLSIFRFYYVWSMLSREEHFNSNQEEYKEAFLLRVLSMTLKLKKFSKLLGKSRYLIHFRM